MTVEELQKLKNDMENEISIAVQKFMDETKVGITRISIEIDECGDSYIVENIKTEMFL